ncbi:hypothetical protein GWI72_18270 [Microvirga tunisiensis]|uniref:Uncharacterized protein n=2 Tax=Pannonibacter tanglangensis TaxID=2750084 RepID=A0ABW9ZKV1_9HYPH|nr:MULTISPECIES: hypothetical protein [unclassified Pannonibacter]NBN65543.1 hypothetical protein [Pannonibacter sp. XCT-34]NBN80230.1 hypothetical protein [Pannonibacter sp. XCT-53]
MTAISGTSAADYSVATRRAEVEAKVQRNEEVETRRTADFERAQPPAEAERREARKIPGLGNAVDISV